MADCKVIVAGAGPAGLAAAALLAKEGVATTIVAPAPGEDPRTVALMQPSIQLLRYLDIWPGKLESETSPLRKLRIIDDTGSLLVAPNLEFEAQDLNLEAFGWNVPLALLLPVLRRRAEDLGVTFVEATATGAVSRDDAIHVTLSNSAEISAVLCLAADGANSALRKAAGIATDTWSYDQTAIATSFAHSMGHDNISTENHKPAGPFTTVPLPENRSSLVWMERPARAEALMAMGDKELAAEIQIETHGELGLISNLGPRKSFPMKGLTARQFAKDRVILIGEAAHVVPPIGAQGLNMSLRDAALAADLILAAKDPGNASVLAEYNAVRRAEVVPRQHLIDLMNKSLLLGFLPLEGARALGLAAVHYFTPLKRFIMERGLQQTDNLPFAMRAS
ncbi:MAG: FAD-dependent monooxygenase [Hyphomicrobiales bacterium]|nr:FAD-dependent monooxygenase [Hyphomicrobiales bacterium]